MSIELQQANTSQQGRMRVLRTRVVFGDDGTTVTLGVLPAGTLVTAMYINVETAFNDSGTDLMSVGRTGDADAYAVTGDTTMTATGLTTAFTGAEAFPRVLTAARTITAIYNGQNSNMTTGAAIITIVYGTCGV